MKKFFIGFALIAFFLTLNIQSAFADTTTSFFVDQTYSLSGNSSVSAVLVDDINNAYFYIETSVWNSKTQDEKNQIKSIIEKLSVNYHYEIYPTLTNMFGTEWIVGTDKKLTILFCPMKNDALGYTRTVDGYEKTTNPFSNQREMIYLNSDKITGPLLKESLTHEFMHLITFNQKERMYGTVEETWLNEARSEYAVTLLGYNAEDKETYLDKRIGDFINNSSDSLTEWRDSNYDYGIVSLFVHYLVEQYGNEILVDSLHSEKKGIPSINEALLKNKKNTTFSQMFSDFSIAIYINDCSVSTKYCFKNDKLKNVRVLPYSNFLPFSGNSKLSINQTIKNWSSQWQKFSGGGDSLDVEVSAPFKSFFKATYIVKKTSGEYSIGNVSFNDVNEGKFNVSNTNKDVSSVVLILSLENIDLDEAGGLPFVYNVIASTDNLNTGSITQSNTDIKLPFTIDKPLNQMNKEELLMVLLRVIIYLVSQGKLTGV